ncbi:MmgE/PrpD family protein [Desulfatibacillum aliphaticivorans]|uniref:MmgE/PrpD family protein n=1 Tax=Desulfatibacillum aliphaticivorans TaxID=218208 RepID=UPI0004195C93|nr:MmgE/PrpD family protein [Desulfatibacillum aliphaticivorans]
MNAPEEVKYTEQLAAFCANIRFEALPAEIALKAKLCILDYIANIYGSLEMDAVNQVVEYIKSLGTSGAASAFGCGFRTDIHNAAFINGTAAEAIEAQDGVRFGGNHPGVSVIPAALALAESKGLDGKKVIEAIAAGYEAADRIAAAMHPWHTLGGFLPTGTCGTFGAAAAAGRLLDFEPAVMASAFGNAGYLLPISTAETLMGGFTVKIVQGGQSASAGLMAAGLAQRNITGAPYIVEGSHLNGGFAKITTAADPTLNRLVQNLGEPYSLEDVYFKPYTACRHTHGAAQATLGLCRESKIDPAAVESIKVFTYGIAQLAVGKQIAPEDTFVSAQFSIPYVVSACLFDGDLGPSQLTEKRLADKELVAFSRKVTVEADDELNAAYPEKTSSRVMIRLKDGTELVKQVDIPKGDPRDPMEYGDVLDKLKRFSGHRDDAKMERIGEAVLNLEKMDDVRELAAMI